MGRLKNIAIRWFRNRLSWRCGEFAKRSARGSGIIHCSTNPQVSLERAGESFWETVASYPRRLWSLCGVRMGGRKSRLQKAKNSLKRRIPCVFLLFTTSSLFSCSKCGWLLQLLRQSLSEWRVSCDQQAAQHLRVSYSLIVSSSFLPIFECFSLEKSHGFWTNFLALKHKDNELL